MQVRAYQQFPTPTTLKNLKASILTQSLNLKKKFYFEEEDYGECGGKEKFLGKIFAIYAILKGTEKYSKKTSKKVNLTFKPHEIQVVTLLLLLGIVESKKESLSNRMA
jgi:hypothetical protein